jgi:Flp pilus assembly protein TadG
MLRDSHKRRGIAATELALCLPFLAFIFIVTVDFCRIFYYSSVVEFASRDGAIYGAQNDPTGGTYLSDVKNAAVRDSSGIGLTTSNVTVTTSPTTVTSWDATGQSITVSVQYTFNTVTNFPGIPTSIVITRTTTATIAVNVPT